MKRGIFYKLLKWIALLFILVKLSLELVVEPLILKKIQAVADNSADDYGITLNKVQVNLIGSKITFKEISFQGKEGGLQGSISEIRMTRIHLIKAIFQKEFQIHKIIFSDINLYGILPLKTEKSGRAVVSGVKIRLDKIVLELSDIQIANDTSSQHFRISNGKMVISDVDLDKNDTVTMDDIKTIDFNIKHFTSVSSDSNYTLQAFESVYNGGIKLMSVKKFQIMPNYQDYVFADRHKYETDRFKVLINNLNISGFMPVNFIRSRDAVCSIISMDTMELEAFRDKRKEFLHEPRKTFQEVLFDYPGIIRIDTIAIKSGNITYIEHAEEAIEAGYITFKKLRANITSISNDTSYINSHGSLKLFGETMLMGKGKLTVLLVAPLLDPRHTFSLEGSLTDMKVEALNPIIENSAFMLARGELKSMNFDFTANDTKSSGTLSLLYTDLDVTVVNKFTGDTTALKERLMTFIANLKLKNSNPLRGNDRVGSIDYERDPEKFLFNYCFKSILSGIKSTLTNDR